ncbi:MAG: hypothetical protein PHN55_06510 [Dysgonamonadaceae bacterium]|nr:hypothetical protein [Dysgonamonadaceae bacterium]
MSMDKFLSRNSTIIEPSYSIYKSKLVKNSIVIIDEFDATKEIVLNNIIKSGSINNISLVDIFRQIYSGLHNSDFTTDLFEVSKYMGDKKKENPKIKTPEEIRRLLTKDIDEIYESFELRFFHKLDENLKNNDALIFQDYIYKTVVGEQGKRLVSKVNREGKKISIVAKANRDNSDLDNNEEIVDSENLVALLSRLKSYL